MIGMITPFGRAMIEGPDAYAPGGYGIPVSGSSKMIIPEGYTEMTTDVSDITSSDDIIEEGAYDNVTSVIVNKIYPMVKKSLDKSTAPLKRVISEFINRNYDLLYAIAPYDRIYFNQKDIDAMFKAFGFTEKEVAKIMEECFFWDQPYNPQCAKEPYVMTLMMAIRYFLLTNKRKDAELVTIYLAFSGKFYSSVHGMLFPLAPPSKYPTVMDYVVNNMLTEKFDIRKYGTVFGAIRSLCITWLDTYGAEIKGKINDDELGKKVQQLRDRERSFMYNISSLYYEAYHSGIYLNYETDNLESGAEFRLTDNDALKAARYTENAMNYLVSNAVSLEICNKCKDQNIKALEIKDIMESIISNNSNHPQLRRVINILICDFMRNYAGKPVSSVEFISHSIKAKPNTKDKYIIELNEIITTWLDANSENYRRRKSRIATQNSYKKAVLMYIVLVINKTSR